MSWSKKVAVVMMSYGMLCGCSHEADTVIVQFVTEVKSKQHESKTANFVLPTMTLCQYNAAHLRDPFQPFVVGSAIHALPHPVDKAYPNRVRELLEAYSLDAFQMVGTIQYQGNFFALLREKTGKIHRASVGQYIGQNAGKIIEVSQDAIKIQEWVLDSKGNWREHTAHLYLLHANHKITG